MNCTLPVRLLGLVLASTPVTLIAEQPKERFVPNAIAVEDVTLTGSNGRPGGKIKRGDLVVANPVMAKVSETSVLDVKTEDGRSGRGSTRSFSRLASSLKVTDDTKSVAESSNQFAFDLYQQARQQDGNIFLSPASISTALAMTYAGAADQTAKEMAAVLHLKQGQNTHPGFSSLLGLLNSTGDRNGYSLSTANRLWGTKNYRFEPAFLDLTRQNYRAELQTLDFGQTEQSRRTINTWVEDQTRKKIVDLIPSGVLCQDTRLVLTNAIYFQSAWAEEFAKGSTKKLPFRQTAQDKSEVLTMQQTDEFPYVEDADAQVLSLPYRGHELSMVIVLPKKVDGLGDVEAKLTEKRFSGWVENLNGDRRVEVYLPKFKMRSQFLLSRALKSMGMASAFSNNADFSAMSRSESLLISEVIHQAFVDVDEEGTEAAAATAVLIAPTSAPFQPKEPPKPIIFRADHPFLFAIRDNRSGAALFIGRVEDPK
jgi:serpin B